MFRLRGLIDVQLKKIIICSLVLITAVLGGCSRTEKLSAPAATENFGFSVLKVGQADAIIMQTANNCVIIDCGEKGDGKKILEYLEENKITSVSKLFITHFDKDHVGGAAKVISNVNVEEIVTPCYKGTSSEYENFLSAAESKGLTPFQIDENRSFILDDVLFEVFPPQKKTYKEGDNDFSLFISGVPENTIVAADEALILSAVTNLISNGIKYGKQGGHIEISASKGDTQTEIVVSDDGIGISKENINKIWGRFFRVDDVRNDEYGSCGLGLSMVMSIVRLHGGSAEVKSEVGKGTEFRITLNNE